ncbi:helix-turn-helix domain-containing protein [Lysinibacillus pakistanensis]|uniref:Helix-turn-helix domain-containing protein n=1 Tax=Lysinibacillus pakistanensis TaxID=759811 RepID=A0ABX6D9Z1_9BACI|nr:helix-turn-helix domain-containing protein [Lysinibacillus pakistanensis]
METLGKRIKYLRERNKISQIEFAKKIGVSNAVLSRYESGDRKPDYDTLQLIADFFEVSTDYLLGRTDKPALTPEEKEEADFQAFANTPELQEFYKELPVSNEEAVKRLRDIWEIIKHERKQ